MSRLGFPLICLREIKVIKALAKHENILPLLDIAADSRPSSAALGGKLVTIIY